MEAILGTSHSSHIDLLILTADASSYEDVRYSLLTNVRGVQCPERLIRHCSKIVTERKWSETSAELLIGQLGC